MADPHGRPVAGVPERYGPWDRVHDLFRRWQRDGTWAGILTALQAEADAKGLITWEVNVNSTACRAHQHAAGAAKMGDLQKEPPGGVFVEPTDHGLGRSRGSLRGGAPMLAAMVARETKPSSPGPDTGAHGENWYLQIANSAAENPHNSAHPRARSTGWATAGHPASDVPAASSDGGFNAAHWRETTQNRP
ncbi:hypothetical protein [Streptomyces sp. NBC_01006]|uniref:hypothetical protein n=1 Tax=Streptomyces sp. NBC_01006 TaxID=2903716 RepID=UPI00386364C5|nr:hypothetical protein OG509_35575 [Streptomyces sp. NBC_01006]